MWETRVLLLPRGGGAMQKNEYDRLRVNLVLQDRGRPGGQVSACEVPQKENWMSYGGEARTGRGGASLFVSSLALLLSSVRDAEREKQKEGEKK